MATATRQLQYDHLTEKQRAFAGDLADWVEQHASPQLVRCTDPPYFRKRDAGSLDDDLKFGMELEIFGASRAIDFRRKPVAAMAAIMREYGQELIAAADALEAATPPALL